jgi:hypothetical protein
VKKKTVSKRAGSGGEKRDESQDKVKQGKIYPDA